MMAPPSVPPPPPNSYSRFDLISLDRTVWGSDVREVLIQYFTLCDDMSLDMVQRRNMLMGSPPGEKPNLSRLTVRSLMSHGR